ncbi:MAG: hypothetical protein ACMXYC_03925 [Candidatus Woesearchaeota archaeon]
MTNITLSMPDEVSIKMKKFSEVRWSEVARKAIIEKIELLDMADALAQSSKLTQKDIDAFNKKIKSSATKRFLG